MVCEAFNDFLVNRKNDAANISNLEKEFVTLLNESQGESQEAILQQYTSIVAGVSNITHSKLLFQLLESAVTNNVTTSRYCREMC